MHVVLVSRRFPPLIGGAEKVLSYLAPALVAEGAKVTVLTSQIAGPPAHEFINGVNIVRLTTSRLRFVGTWLYMRNLRRWFAKTDVDIAYVSMLKHDAYVTIGMGHRRGFPVVLRPEGAGVTGDVAWQKWGRGGQTIARRCKAADGFVAISDAVHDELTRAGYNPSKIMDLPNGVPVPDQPWMIRTGWEPSPCAVFVGRLAVEKGLHSLMESWPIVRRVFPKARLILVGDGPERTGLIELRNQLFLGDSVELPGASTDPTATLRASDLFILPSREEGMSIALLEAMALGMPIVASSIPGNRKLITDGIHGRLFIPDDSESLARAIIDQWIHLTPENPMGVEARRRVVEHYSIRAVARSHLELFDRLTRG